MAGKKMLKSMLSLLIFALVIAVPSGAYSEAVFLKDGTIAEGVISVEDDAKIILKPSTGAEITIPRNNILRILVHKRYKDRIYLTRADGFTYEGFIVNEDNNKITLRTSLQSAAEINVAREDIITISRKKPSENIVPAVNYSSVFLKDGEIIDCRIVREGIRFIEVSPLEGERRIIQRSDIMRIQYNNSYKNKKVFSKRDGTKIEGYIMEENNKEYIFRRDLSSPEEGRVFKNDLSSISGI